MEQAGRDAGDLQGVVRVLAGQDRLSERRGLDISEITFKVTPADIRDALVLENTFRRPGGPPRHLHHEQDEWFYAIEGEFSMEIGSERFTLQPGDSALGRKGIPHVWACTGTAIGRILIAFFPAGQMEAFFREVTSANAMPPQDPDLFHKYGMELLGPPLLQA